MGLDQLFSGSDGLRGWGQRASPDATLLYTRGFDPVGRSFRYDVNERFGNARQSRISIGSPFPGARRAGAATVAEKQALSTGDARAVKPTPGRTSERGLSQN